MDFKMWSNPRPHLLILIGIIWAAFNIGTSFGFSNLICVTSPLAVPSSSSKPITLQAIVDSESLIVEAYSITFSSRDDPLFVTNGNRAEYGKIGTIKGEKGDKGERGDTACAENNGNPGVDGADGSSPGPGPAGPRGTKGSKGDRGSNGTPSSSPSTPDGQDEFYCLGAVVPCGSDKHSYQCRQLAKGIKGRKGTPCVKGRMGEKGEPPKPNLLGPEGPPGPKGEKGGTGPKGGEGALPKPGVDAPQPDCTLSTQTASPGLIIDSIFAVGGDPGDHGFDGFAGAKGVKGAAGTPATPGSVGVPGPPGLPGPSGRDGDFGEVGVPGTSANGRDGLFIRPLYRGPNPEPTCVTNIPVAAETLTLHKPDEAHSEDGRFGVYHCNFNSFYVKRHTPVLLYNQDVLIPKDAKRSFVVSVGEELTLCVDDAKLPKNCLNQLEWVIDGKRTEKLRRWNGSPCVHIKRVTTADAGIYEAYRRPVGRNAKQHAYFIVIVRPCPDGKYGYPSCILQCPVCLNGGYCADNGRCQCLHGFGKQNCDPLGEGNIGNDIIIPCIDLGHGRSCEGALVCNEHVGCSCAHGWKGIRCDEPCPLGTYGPDCCLDCPAELPECNRFTGEACLTSS
ncbi:uncharacterized protein [Apostichopus japonicus]|uniref:uncharacterized protein n=1 Tax=Stichopus japonicus TaxID=307972 RepID=UPI003AB7AD2F